LLLTAGWEAAPAADATNFCVNASGLVRLLSPPATGCRISETLVTINAQGGGGSLNVIDATGAVIGTVLGLNFVALDIGGNKVVVGAGPNGLFTKGEGFTGGYPLLAFATTNCTGTAYIADGNSNFPQLSVFVSTNPQTGGTLYYPTGNQISISLQSGLSDGSCFPIGAGAGYLAQSTTLSYTTPFSVQ
jgi:hypothetical protein